MKRIFIALMVAMTFCSLAMAQNQTITQNNNDSSDSTFVAEYTDIVDSSTVDTDYQSSSSISKRISVQYGQRSY